MILMNNWRRSLTEALPANSTTMSINDDAGFGIPQGEAVTLTLGDTESSEIVHATTVTGSVLEITRGREGTTAKAWPIGTAVEQRVTAGVLQQLKAEAVAEAPEPMDEAPAAVEPVLGYLRSDGQWIAFEQQSGGGGGLTHWRELDNGVLAVLTPILDRDVAIVVPEGKSLSLSADGDARGAGSVDLQVSRTAADQVAAGSDSAIMAGKNNKISAGSEEALVSCGDGNKINDGYSSAIVGGYGHEIETSFYSLILGGYYNEIKKIDYSGYGPETCTVIASSGNSIVDGSMNSAIIGGWYNTMTESQDSAMLGCTYTEFTENSSVGIGAHLAESTGWETIVTGGYATDRGIPGAFVFGGAVKSGGLGVAQVIRHMLAIKTTDATSAGLKVGPYNDGYITLTDHGAYAMTGTVVAREGSDAKAWRISVLAVVDAAGMSIIGAPTVDVMAVSTGADSWELSVGATGNTLDITATGEAARSIQWSGFVDSAESA